MEKRDKAIVIAGAGIGGLTLALTLHQIGVHCIVLESVGVLKPLGVGINLQPNAVRELYDLGINASELDQIGIQTKEWALVGRNGKDVYAEPRGISAGYQWPQYSVHRGQLQLLLYKKLKERLGPNCVRTDARVTGYRNTENGVAVSVSNRAGQTSDVIGALLIGADGLHSVVRAQMHPNQPPISWSGAILWRGVSEAKPLRTGASFVGLGSHTKRMVMYPIGPAHPETGLATINWIAEVTVDPSAGWGDSDWNKQVDLDHFVHHFKDWQYEWLDVPALVAGATEIFEYPMVDRDPIDNWVDGNVLLIGDAAHVMYPTGSNGASQAIVDARILGPAILAHGTNALAIQSVEQRLCAEVSAVVLRNRSAGPFRLLNILDERCGGVFDDIEQVFPAVEREEIMRDYKTAAGYAAEKLNAAEPTIASGAKIQS